MYHVLSRDDALYMDIQQTLNLGTKRRFAGQGIESAYPIRTAMIVMLTTIVAFLVATQVQSQERWPGWRGPDRDGSLVGFSAPEGWPDRLELKWKQEIGSGYASPVVSDGRVYVFSRQEGRELVSCLELTSGKILWQQSYPAPHRVNPAAASHGPGPKSTPVLHDGKLCVFGLSGILSCYEAKSGIPLWRRGFSDQFSATAPLYGTAMSPLAEAGLLYLHAGGNDDGAFTAFSISTGEVEWRWDGDGPAYASPILAEIGGVRQIVTFTQENLVGLDVSTGKDLWRIPFATAWTQNSVTPLVLDDKIIYSGLERGITAVKVTRSGDKWSTETLWENDDLSMYMSSPVVDGDLLFGLSQYKKGQFFCLDVRTGKTLWVSGGRQGDNAAVLRGDGLLFLLTNGAKLVVAPASAEGFAPIRTYEVAESPTWAHPAILGNQILIKDDSSIALWTLGMNAP